MEQQPTPPVESRPAPPTEENTYSPPTEPEPGAGAPANSGPRGQGASIPGESPASDKGRAWYVFTEGEVWGPYATREMRQWLRSGRITPTTLVTAGAADKWREAQYAAELTSEVGPLGIPDWKKERVPAGILALFLGFFGGHHLYLQNWLIFAFYLAAAIMTGATLSMAAGIIEGVIYLTSSDEKFADDHDLWMLTIPKRD